MPVEPVRTRRTTIHDLLAEARRRLDRLTPAQAYDALLSGAVLVDTRTDEQRRTEGAVPGARCFPLSELEWWLDPDSGHSDPAIGLEAHVVVLCAEGYSSSLAAARLQAIGFRRATDVIGGSAAWKAAGLPLLSSPPR
jgi:rhodanese-related sulfurtransferase